MADISNGYRRIVQLGNTNHNNSWTIKNIPRGSYHWSTQAIDNAFAGSAFATEESFTVPNHAPTVANVSIDIFEDSTLTFTSSIFRNQFNDLDGDSMSKIMVVDLPLHGTLKLSGNDVTAGQEIDTSEIANLTYTPDINYDESDSFNWNGHDGTVYADNDAVVNITIDPINDAPVVEGIPDISFPEDGLYTLDLDDYVNDIDDDLSELVWTASLLESVTREESDSILVTIDEITHIATFTPTENYHVSDVPFEFTALDTSSASDSDTMFVTVTPVNDPPFVTTPIGDITLNEDDPDTLIADLDDVFEDIEGDALTYSSSVSNENVIISVDSVNAVTISLTTNWNGSATAIFTASDGEFAIDDTVIIVVNEVNDDPTTPVILLPLNGTELDSNGYLVWTLSSDVDPEDILSYHIQLDDSSNFDNPEIDESGIGLSTILRIVENKWQTGNRETSDSAFVIQLDELTQYGNLMDNTIYFWRIRSLDNNDGQSDWTAGSHNFFFNQVNTPPAAVVSGFNPADSIVVGTITPTISWNAATDPDMSDNAENLHYLIQLDDDGEFIANYEYQYITEPGITSLVADELTEDNQWYYRIQTIDDGGLESFWSETQIFWVNSENSPPNEFALLYPEEDSILTTLEVHLDWEDSDDPDPFDSVSYSLYYGEDLEDIIEIDSIAESEYDLVPDDNTIYYWGVIANDLSEATTENNDGLHSFIINTANDNPSTVALLSPDSVVALTLTPDFHWTEASDPDPYDEVYYEMHWWEEGHEITDSVLTDTNYCTVPTPLNDNTMYYWQVLTMDQTDGISHSEEAVFWTDTYPEPPLTFRTIFPEDSINVLVDTVVFTWQSTSDPDPLDYVQYSLVYSPDWSDTNTYVYHDVGSDTSAEVIVEFASEYYWQVWAFDEDSLITISDSNYVMYFTVGELGISGDRLVPLSFALHQNFPNPFNPVTTLRYDLPEQVHITLIVYDLLGREVVTLVNQVEEPGYKSVIWDATNDLGQSVGAGLYLVQIQTRSYTQTRKMILLK